MISTLSLQRGSPIDIGICKVYPLLLEEIEQLGEMKYLQYLHYLTLDISSLDISQAPQDEIDFVNNMSSLDIILYQSYHSVELRKLICEAISFFIKEPVKYHLIDDGIFYVGDDFQRVFTSDNYDWFKLALQKQNYLSDKKQDSEKEFKPANDKAAELIEKMKKAKEKIQKQNNDEGLHLSDIISIVANYSNDVNMLTVWKLTVYQLYECYLRLIMWDDYHASNLHLPHMDEEARKQLKHWARKINI